jgi:hypothetical protein
MSPVEMNEVSLYEVVKRNAGGAISIKVLDGRKTIFAGIIHVSDVRYAKRK